MKKLFLIFVLIFSINKSFSQSQGIAVNLGYNYINTNAGYIGGEYAYRFDPNNWHGMSIGAGAYYGSFNGNFKFIPAANLTYTNTLFLTEFSITPYNINPSIGFNFLNMIRLKGGYSWKLGHENVNMTGVTFGINLLIGTKGFYDSFKMM